MSGGPSSAITEFGVATDEERHLTMMLFWGIFDALAKKVSDNAKNIRLLMHEKGADGRNSIAKFTSQISLEIQPNRDSKSSAKYDMSSVVNTVQAIGKADDFIQRKIKKIR